MAYTSRTADVFPYDKSYEPMTNVPIVSGATAYDDPDGETYILIFHESLYYGTKLEHSLINPNQIRHNDVEFWDNPYDNSHDLCIHTNDGLVIPLTYEGTKLVFHTRVPSKHELATCHHVDMTSKEIWEPSEVTLGEISRSSKRVQRQIFSVKVDEHHASTHEYSRSVHEIYRYVDPSSDEAILNEVNPVLIQMTERIISKTEINDSHVISDDREMDDVPSRRTFVSTERHKRISAESLSELWAIGPNKARATLRVTTQNGVRSAILPLSRRYRSDRMYNVKRLKGRFATDTIYSIEKSIHGNICAQIFSQKIGFAACYPMLSAKGDPVGNSLNDFVHDFGVPEHLTFDGAQVQIGKKTLFQSTLNKHRIKYHVSAPRRPNENPAEGAIREIKRRYYRVLQRKNVPQRLWDYLLVWICETGNLSVSSSRYANGRTSIEIITGETPDISEYVDFGFYDWVVYRSNAGLGENYLGRWLGVSHKVGQLMSYWILPISGRPISCVTVQRLTNSEMQTDEWQGRMSFYNEQIAEKLNAKDSSLIGSLQDVPDWNRLSVDEGDPHFDADFNKIISDDSIPEADNPRHTEGTTDYTPDAFDPYLSMEIGLPRGDDDLLLKAKVKRRAIDIDGNPIGIANDNPMIDTRQYEVEYVDGSSEVLAANIIAENLLAQVDSEGHRQIMLDEIVDHRSNDSAIKKEDGFYRTSHNTKQKKRTTRGWELCVQWKDGSSNWVALKDLKNSYPVELADYAISNKLEDEPAFAWWIPYTIKKRKIIISKLKSKYWERTHKYGFRIPKNVEEALEIDKETNTTFWRDAINEEMKKVRVAFEEHEGDPNDLVGYQKISTHLIFDIKLSENFRRKARLVADGHKTQTPKSVTYSSVVSRDSVRICLLLAALNDLDIKCADIENAYLTAPCREKVWTTGGKEFGSDIGKNFIVVKALYGLKSSGAAFRSFLAEKLDEIGYKPSMADPDVWMRPATKPDKETYYEYLLVHVDDLMSISLDPERPLREIASDFKLKKDKVSAPDFYLGANIQCKSLNGRDVWTMSSRDYVKAAIETVEKQLQDKRQKLPTKVATPMKSGYRPELDMSTELEINDITTFQELIGILRWAIELGRVDILTEVSMLSSYQASPREGHLEQVYHIFGFLKRKPKLSIYFNPELPKIDPEWFTGDTPSTFREQYRDAKEELPPRMPKPRGRSVSTSSFADASHAANKVTRRSHTGFVIFVNRAPIIWYSKRQNTVESSTFGSEFIALKTCVEHITALRYKLRMFGVPVDGPTYVLCDNLGVVQNSSKIESTLNKKHSSIAYHAVRWSVASDVIKVGWINTCYNIADALTKLLTEVKREQLFGDWTY